MPEQHRVTQKDKSYIVYLKLDNKGRIVASSKLDHFLDKSPAVYKKGEEVNILLAENTPVYRAMIKAPPPKIAKPERHFK